MNVGLVGESPADEAALQILINTLRGHPNDFIFSARARAGGWSGVISAIETALRHLHYNTEGHVLVAVLDSDDSPLHDASHEAPDGDVEGCRICKIAKRIEAIRPNLKRRQHVNYPVLTAIGLAVPALEAWLLCGTDPAYYRGQICPR